MNRRNILLALFALGAAPAAARDKLIDKRACGPKGCVLRPESKSTAERQTNSRPRWPYGMKPHTRRN